MRVCRPAPVSFLWSGRIGAGEAALCAACTVPGGRRLCCTAGPTATCLVSPPQPGARGAGLPRPAPPESPDVPRCPACPGASCRCSPLTECTCTRGDPCADTDTLPYFPCWRQRFKMDLYEGNFTMRVRHETEALRSCRDMHRAWFRQGGKALLYCFQ